MQTTLMFLTLTILFFGSIFSFGLFMRSTFDGQGFSAFYGASVFSFCATGIVFLIKNL